VTSVYTGEVSEPIEVELCDALARGRISLAELAGITARELDAVFALGTDCLEQNRDADAATLLGGLVSLFPFDARYVRAYGVALHRLSDWPAAKAAYLAALAMQPGHALTSCHLGEVLLGLGDHAAAREALTLAAGDSAVAPRAKELLRRLEPPSFLTTAAETTGKLTSGETSQRFVLRDARPLPLATSRLAALEHGPISEAQLMSDETSASMRRPVELDRDETTATATMPAAPAVRRFARQVTDTALLPDRQGASGPVAKARPDESTDTAQIHRRRESTDTAQVERRARAERSPEVTHTAIIRRGSGLPLELDGEPEND
jgi:hypothetical protein